MTKNFTHDELKWFINNAERWEHGDIIIKLCKELLNEMEKKKAEIYHSSNHCESDYSLMPDP